MNKKLSIEVIRISKIVLILEKDVLLEGSQTADRGYVYIAQGGMHFGKSRFAGRFHNRNRKGHWPTISLSMPTADAPYALAAKLSAESEFELQSTGYYIRKAPGCSKTLRSQGRNFLFFDIWASPIRYPLCHCKSLSCRSAYRLRSTYPSRKRISKIPKGFISIGAAEWQPQKH